MKNKKKTCTNKSCFIKKNLWQIISIFLFVLLLVLVGILFSTSTIEKEEVNYFENASYVGQETKIFLEKAFEIDNIILSKSIFKNNLYIHTFNIEENNFEIYTSTDGEIIFVPGISEPIKKSEFLKFIEDEKPKEVIKSNVPKVELFVMSHCPFGIQIQKGILPVLDTLQDTIDFEMKFVNYSMRPDLEVQEQLLQYCIQKDLNEKYNEYLYCFLEDGNSERCIEKNNILLDTLNDCLLETDEKYNITTLFEDKSTWLNNRFPQFLIHDQENQEYGVKGSPTIVINGTVVSSSRDPNSLLKTICDAFDTKPRACNEQLSREVPSSTFGFENQGSNVEATCG